MSYAVPNEPKADQMGRLGNALSQMHLDSRSENLLEEKELEVCKMFLPDGFDKPIS